MLALGLLNTPHPPNHPNLRSSLIVLLLSSAL